MEEEDEFFDTASLRSYASATKRRNSDKNYLSLSRNTIYHSAVDLEMEMESLTQPNNHQNKVTKNDKTVTYSQWKYRSWRRFSKVDLSVDFVLAYRDHNYPGHQEKREVFEQNLEEEGLVLEKEANQKVNFVKIHAPQEVLMQYAEILKLRLPIKEDNHVRENTNFMSSLYHKALNYCKIELDDRKFKPSKTVLTATFSKGKDYLFDVNAPNFFTCSSRIEVVSYILQRTQFGKEEQDRGIKKLLNERVYKAAYPLHDGDLFTEGSERKLLYEEWASICKCVKFQPIDNIKEYFGVKIALYFTWLGFYTHMLIPASIIGLFCFIYGLATLHNDSLIEEICNSTLIMCPLCDKNCDYWHLSSTCEYSKLVHIIDNSATIFFSVFMSFWAALYLELWKRYSAEVTHRWGMTGFGEQCEPPRPEYLSQLKQRKGVKIDSVTDMREPALPFWTVKLPSLVLSFSIAFFWVFLAVAVVCGVVIYRMSLLATDRLYGGESTEYLQYVLPFTAGLMNLIGIVILNYGYNILAVWLTDLELQRTQSEYDNSLSLKIYMFQFVNYYSSIFYIAFIKGKFVGYPAKYNRFFGYRQEECNAGGCLAELTIHLAIIMIGNQAFNAICEMVLPFLKKAYNTFKTRAGLKKVHSDETVISCNQWTEDYKLLDMEPQGLFYEYLEMVLQYGFVTIFVTAFPLAPLFALINNILELRLDAKKMIKFYRRPIPQRVKDIGVWLPVMDVLGRIAVVSNAFIIAFSSHFIPQLIYYLHYNKTSVYGYLNFTLSEFNTEDFVTGTGPDKPTMDVATCRYSEFRNPPNHPQKYKRPLIYWHILAARLAFIVVYQNLVGVVISLVQWVIPDVSKKLQRTIQKEAYKTAEIIIKHETERAKLKFRKKPNRHSYHQGDSNGDIHMEGPSEESHRNSLRNSLYHDTVEVDT